MKDAPIIEVNSNFRDENLIEDQISNGDTEEIYEDDEVVAKLPEETCGAQKFNDDDDAPEEINFKESKEIALNKIIKEEQIEKNIRQFNKEKRKKIEQRNIEQKKIKKVKSDIYNHESDNISCEEFDDESFEFNSEIKSKTIPTARSEYKILSSENDQITKMYQKHIKKNALKNNRVVSFKDRIVINKTLSKRISPSKSLLLLHKGSFRV